MSLTFTAYRYSAILRRIFLLLFSLAACSIITAQNLFVNPGFEDLNICTEYNSPCAPEAWFYIRPTTNPLVNNKLAIKPMLGHNLLLVPMSNVFDPNGMRPYVYTKFGCPLAAGEKYKLSFYINTAKRKFYNLDFYLTNKEPAERYIDFKKLTATFSITEKDIVAEMKQDWKAIEYFFTATGNEQFCMLGNLSQPMEYEIKDKMNASGTVFYFLDEVKLTTIDHKPLCTTFDENVKRIYAQNSRHTDYVLIDTIIPQPTLPIFVTDTITVPAVFFETNSALLKPSFKKIMDSLVNILEHKKLTKIDIVGHTDNKGKPSDNLILSLNRAASVKNYLANKLPQYAENIFTIGKGQELPIADNKTEQGRTKNRRVEIILTTIDKKL